MRINHIIKYKLESRAIDLKGTEKALEEIASILSSESKQQITKSTVFRYFEANEHSTIQAIEKHDNLRARIAEAEISTIEGRLKVIDGLMKLAGNQEVNERIRIRAYSVATKALDSLDIRLGKLSSKKTRQ